MKLTAENVHEIFTKCLFREGEDTSTAALAECVTGKFGFHPGRLEQNRESIHAMLKELPPEFQPDTGGGMSFLNACMTKDGEQWGEHRNIEQLLALGVASKTAAILLPRPMWAILPGGMPYFAVV